MIPGISVILRTTQQSNSFERTTYISYTGNHSNSCFTGGFHCGSFKEMSHILVRQRHSGYGYVMHNYHPSSDFSIPCVLLVLQYHVCVIFKSRLSGKGLAFQDTCTP